MIACRVVVSLKWSWMSPVKEFLAISLIASGGVVRQRLLYQNFAERLMSPQGRYLSLCLYLHKVVILR